MKQKYIITAYSVLFLIFVSVLIGIGIKNCTTPNSENIPTNSMVIVLGDDSKTYDVESIQKIFKPTEVHVVSPAYGHLSIDDVNVTKIRYKAVLFSDVIQEFLSKIPTSERPNYKMVISCADGYHPVLELDVLNKGAAYLAYEEVQTLPNRPTSNDSKWTLVDMSQGMGDPNFLSPAPFYLVWDTTDTYPTGWPFAVQKIEFVKK